MEEEFQNTIIRLHNEFIDATRHYNSSIRRNESPQVIGYWAGKMEGLKAGLAEINNLRKKL